MSLVIPTALFVLLSPGLLVQLPGSLRPTMRTSSQSVLIHTLVFMAVYWFIAKAMGLALTKADLVVPTILFLLLSPHYTTNFNTVILRAVAFAVIFALLRKVFPQYY
jgi:hypothetical protein